MAHSAGLVFSVDEWGDVDAALPLTLAMGGLKPAAG
jgi:hypothetical protein